MPAATPEGDLLAPRPPTTAATNSDDWPEFELTNVLIHAPDDPTATRNLLDANEDNPLTVLGQLEPLPTDLAHLARKPSVLKRTERIEISDVRTIAYGQYEDETIALWAAGRAGWYSLKPGRLYRDMFSRMSNTVRLWYTIVDTFKSPRLQTKFKGRNRPLEQQVDLALKHMNTSYDMLGENLDFLLSSMIAGREGINWDDNFLYLFLRDKFPECHDRTFVRIRGQSQKGKMVKRQTREESGDPDIPNRARRRTRAQRTKFREATDHKSNAIIASRNTSSTNGHKHSSVTRRSRRGSPEASESMDEVANSPQLVMTPVRDSDDDDDDDDNDRARARKGKSSLRLRSGAANKAVARRGGKALPTQDSYDINDDDDDTLRSSPVPAKRKREDGAEAGSPPKRSDSRRRWIENHPQPEDEGIDIPSSPESGGPLTETAAPTGIVLGDTKFPEEVLHRRDQLQDDTWICALDGCSHKIYTASQPSSQRLIREHYALHAYDDDERVMMVKTLQAPSLPTQHLMEKVKLRAKLDGFPGSRATSHMGPAGDRFPTIIAKPVMQRY